MPDSFETVDPIDPITVLQAIGLSEVDRVMPVSGGADTMVWRVERGTETFALRIFRPEQVAICRYEVTAVTAAAAGGLPVPTVHAEGRWRDRPALLLSWCRGIPLLDALQACPEQAVMLGERFGEMQAVLHNLAAPATFRNDDERSWLRWAGDDPALAARFADLTPRRDCLLHLDYHPLNVLTDGRRVTAILDWANARAGDPRADLTRTQSILEFGPIAPVDTTVDAEALRRDFISGWLTGYQAIAGPVGDLSPFMAWVVTVMERELRPRLGRADLPWLTAELLDRVRQSV